MTELKPCPMCGSKATIQILNDQARAICMNADCGTQIYGRYADCNKEA